MTSITYAALVTTLFFSAGPAAVKPVNPVVYHNTEAKSGEIQFVENAWSTALKRAKAEGKYIFVDAYAVWCGPCKLLKSTTFKDKGVADFFNTHFVNLSIDMEKGEGLKLAEQWQVNAYPTLLIVDSNGTPVLGHVGFMKPDALLKFGEQALQKGKRK